jgi:hypothetical protein
MKTAVSDNKTADVKALAGIIQQTQSQSYLTGLVTSLDANDFAGAETLQVMNEVVSNANNAALQKLTESAQQTASAVPKSDITNTPFTQTTDKTGQILDVTV